MKGLFYKMFLTVVICSLLSCNGDFLEKPPLDKIGNNYYWKTSRDLEKYVSQFYTIFPAYNVGDSYGGVFSRDAFTGSDDMITSTVNPMLNGTQATPTSGGKWAWQTIRSVNIFFENYARCEDDFQQYKHFVGEAHFFKAFLYFDKVLSYGDVPWFTHSLQTNSEELYKARDPRVLVVDSILMHLDKAIAYLDPLSSVNGGNNRISKEAALIFKSRVGLFEGSWQKYHAGTAFATPGADPRKYFRAAVEAAEELMSGKYRVGLYNVGNPEENYYSLFGHDNYSDNNEVILWKSYDRGLSLSHDSQRFLTVSAGDVSITLSLIESYLDKAGKPYDYRSVAGSYKGNNFLQKIASECDPRLSQTIWIPGNVMWDNLYGLHTFARPSLAEGGLNRNSTGFQLKKGSNPHSAGAGAPTGGNSLTGAIIFRYAEALLNYAEAKYELDGNVDYNKSINLLRRRVQMPDFATSFTEDPFKYNHSDYGYVLPDELYEIRRERRIELGCEGFRHHDFRRWAAHALFKGKLPKGYPFNQQEWGTQIIPTPVDEKGLLDPLIGNLGPGGYGFKPERDYLEGIPVNEITINPALKQNPGWN